MKLHAVSASLGRHSTTVYAGGRLSQRVYLVNHKSVCFLPYWKSNVVGKKARKAHGRSFQVNKKVSRKVEHQARGKLNPHKVIGSTF